jgi:hypothetical protein
MDKTRAAQDEVVRTMLWKLDCERTCDAAQAALDRAKATLMGAELAFAQASHELVRARCGEAAMA